MIPVRRPRLLETLLVVLLLAGSFPGLDAPLSIRPLPELDGEELAARPVPGPRATVAPATVRMVRTARPGTAGAVLPSLNPGERAAPEPVRARTRIRLLIQRINE